MTSVPNRATTRATLCSWTCYDAFLLNELSFAELCGNCRNYLQIPYKKKKQSEMGRRDYQCTTPGNTSKIIGLSSTTPVAKRNASSVNSENFDNVKEPPPLRKKVKYKEINSELWSSIKAATKTAEVLPCDLDDAHLLNQSLSLEVSEESFANCCLKE